MKKIVLYLLVTLFSVSILTCCNRLEKAQDHQEEHVSHKGHEEDGHGRHNETGMHEVHLSELKFKSLGMKVDTLPVRLLSGVVQANGQLQVPPQHEASVTAILGANVTSIKVLEGDPVRKGQVLAYIAHPDLVKIQSNYINAYNQLQFLEKEYERQKKLYEKKVGSGQKYQQVAADYRSRKGEVKGYEAQLKQLNLNIGKIKSGDVYENVPVISPINGYIEKVFVRTGQYVSPQTQMFLIVNNDHIHADLMVFEKDVFKVKKGQKVHVVVQSVPDTMLSAKIFAVGKKFEQNPKAVHVHAEIDDVRDLIPGMYINGKIHTEGNSVRALPEDAIIEEEGKPYIFLAKQHNEEDETEWAFEPIEIRTGMIDGDWVEIKLLEPLPKGSKVALNNTYYLVSEMRKSQTSHSH